MTESNDNINFDKIVCKTCNSIQKIKIFTNWEKRDIIIKFECAHIKKGIISNDFCINCRTEKKEECLLLRHDIINKINFYFYCHKHYKKIYGYCDVCSKNLCEECECQHENFKYNYEYYFSYNQLQNLSDIFEEVKNYINAIYSIECNNRISSELLNYYNVYTYMFENQYFDSNIIYNISLFYNFFRFCLKSRIISDGSFFSLNVNDIEDNCAFYDEKFKEEYSYLLDLENFDNITRLFLLSKKFKIQKDLYQDFVNDANSSLINILIDSQIINDNISRFYDSLFELKQIIKDKAHELQIIKNEINIGLLSIKLSEIIIPLNLKRKLINILQRAILNKYKDYLHKIKSNYFIINSIKKKYDSLKKNNEHLFNNLNFNKKVEEIEKIKPDINNNDIIDYVYFQLNFEHKNLCNSFIYFTQILFNQKSNETDYSKNIFLPFHQSFSQLNDSKEKTKLNTEDDSKSNNNKNIIIENDGQDEILYNKNKTEEKDPLIDTNLNEYIFFLETIKKIFRRVFGNYYIKRKMSFECIVNALFKGDFSGVILSEHINNDGIDFFDEYIGNYIEKLKNIPKEELKEANNMKKYFNNIISNKSFEKIINIFMLLSNRRKYKDLIEKIKENNDDYSYNNLFEKLKNEGGFDQKIANLVCKIIEKYFSNNEEIICVKKEFGKIPKYIEKYSLLSFEISQLKEIKDYINLSGFKLKDNDNTFELNKIEQIKNNFEKNEDYYINQVKNDEEFKKILKEICLFVKNKDVKSILETIKILFQNDESEFYFDDTINLATYCWGIQNGHDLILNY